MTLGAMPPSRGIASSNLTLAVHHPILPAVVGVPPYVPRLSTLLLSPATARYAAGRLASAAAAHCRGGQRALSSREIA